MLTLIAAALLAQPGQGIQQFITVSDSIVALTNVRVIDGTGAPARTGQTLVLKSGVIQAVGTASQVSVPPGARTLDLDGRTVMPGYVMLHEHLFYPSGGGAIYHEQGYSFPRLYLAGGVTTMRTGGNMAGYADINIKRAIDAGTMLGPAIDVTAPYLEGPGLPIPQVKALRGPEDARKMVAYWADEGATSFKAYMNISRATLGAAIDEAHKRGLKVTGHLCSVTFREAAALGIDDLEHGFIVASDFVPDKKPDECPTTPFAVQRSIASLDVNGAPVRDLIAELVKRRVAITSTLTIFETFVRAQPGASTHALEAMLPEARRQYEQSRAGIPPFIDSLFTVVLRKEMQLEKMFADAGGLLVVGTDPTGFGGVVAGYANQRALELLVEAGFTPLEAIRIATLNGATYLGREARIGSIAVGKQADLVVVRGDPSTSVGDVKNVELVFKQGVGYDSPKIFASVKGRVGLH
ncbi:MAG: amidohydrolase [Geminicoccaceae bacterium]|nr:amidohydrolase [Geminicoccaceae bacterium]